jgi:hypothetical protein
MIYKMLGIHRSWQLHDTSLPMPRQIFVTKSSVLAVKVQEYYSRMLHSLEMSTCTAQELTVQAALRQESVQQRSIQHMRQADAREDLPSTYSELADHHFPLFVALDQVHVLRTRVPSCS